MLHFLSSVVYIFVIVVVMVVAVAIVALVSLDTLILSLVPQKIYIYPQSLRPIASTTTLNLTNIKAWVVCDPPPSLDFPMASSSRLRCRAGTDKRGTKGRRVMRTRRELVSLS